MDISWIPMFMLAAVFMSTIVLVVVCLDCRKQSPLVSISQTTASEERVPNIGFIVIHPSLPHPDQNSIHCLSSLLPPYSNSMDRGSDQRLRPYTPTETESNPSYRNQAPGMDFPDSDAEDNGYIKVIPESTSLSRASTPSSDLSTDIDQYVNIKELKPDTDSASESNYLNVEDVHHHERSTPILSSRNEDDDDDEEGNYVNQPPMIHS